MLTANYFSSHTHAAEHRGCSQGHTMIKRRRITCAVVVTLLLAASLRLHARQLPSSPITLPPVTFAPGDLIVSLEPGPVLWLTADGVVRRVLAQTSPGTGEGMALDAGRTLYVTRWCIDPLCGAAADGVIHI